MVTTREPKTYNEFCFEIMNFYPNIWRDSGKIMKRKHWMPINTRTGVKIEIFKFDPIGPQNRTVINKKFDDLQNKTKGNGPMVPYNTVISFSLFGNISFPGQSANTTGENICFIVHWTRLVNDFDIEFKWKFWPPCLPAIQKFVGYKIFQVFMVGIYLYGLFNIFQFRLP